jgi:hypothetical protein
MFTIKVIANKTIKAATNNVAQHDGASLDEYEGL